MFHHRYDTHPLHTLAELCLRRADFDYAQLQDSSKVGNEEAKSAADRENARNLQSLHATRENGQHASNSLGMKFVKKEREGKQELRNITGHDKKRIKGEIPKKEPGSRLNKVEEELEKMLQ